MNKSALLPYFTVQPPSAAGDSRRRWSLAAWTLPCRSPASIPDKSSGALVKFALATLMIFVGSKASVGNHDLSCLLRRKFASPHVADHHF